MVDLFEEAVRLQAVLENAHCRFCFIGGLAVQHWGEPRLTRDIDVSLLAGFGSEEHYVDLLLASYAPRMSEARVFALARRVLLLTSPGGIGIDVSLAALPFEEGMTHRSVQVELIPGSKLRLCSPEDLIVLKVFAGRETDLRDARSVVVRQTDAALDWTYIETHLADLGDLKGDASLVDQVRHLRA